MFSCDMELASVRVFSCVLVSFCEESVKYSGVRSSRYDGLSGAVLGVCVLDGVAEAVEVLSSELKISVTGLLSSNESTLTIREW